MLGQASLWTSVSRLNRRLNGIPWSSSSVISSLLVVFHLATTRARKRKPRAASDRSGDRYYRTTLRKNSFGLRSGCSTFRRIVPTKIEFSDRNGTDLAILIQDRATFVASAGFRRITHESAWCLRRVSFMRLIRSHRKNSRSTWRRRYREMNE